MRIFLYILLCVVSINIHAQNFGGGLILGLSTSQVSGDHLGGFNKAGLLVGGFVNLQLSNTLKGQMEMTFIQKGAITLKWMKMGLPILIYPMLKCLYF